MTAQPASRTLDENEKITPCMVYLPMRLIWGNLISKKGIRVETWLKMTLLPDYLTFLDAQMLIFGGPKPVRQSYAEIYAPLSEILAYHLLPPALQHIEMDYDPNEPNRKMEPTTVYTSVFRFDGYKRISTLGDFSTAIATSKEVFTPLYDVTVSHPIASTMKPLSVPYLLLRHANATYARKG